MSTDLDALNTLRNQTIAGQNVATAFLGPPIMGWMAHMALFGCMATTAFNYVGTEVYQNDPLGTKVSAGVFFVLVNPSYGALNFNSIMGIFFWLMAGTDLIVTTALVFSLRRHIVGFNESTDSALHRIINLSMRTASFTSLFSTLGAIFSSVPYSWISTTNVLFAFAYPLGSLYTLSLISTLAARRSITSGEGTTKNLTIRSAPMMKGVMVEQERVVDEEVAFELIAVAQLTEKEVEMGVDAMSLDRADRDPR
ncbi:hypothetical protein MNV49_003557 [Pseudohyphozyma bogoriensis]|nr:hypothetical protein MNV49_003557 [Pseudohyphozyma bogoriensis]